MSSRIMRRISCLPSGLPHRDQPISKAAISGRCSCLAIAAISSVVSWLRACLKLSRLEHALEAHAGHEQRGEHGHVPRGVGARLVVDPQAAVALQAAEGLLDLPAPLL